MSLTEHLRDLEASVSQRVVAEQEFARQFSVGPDPHQETLAQRLAEMVDRHQQQEATLKDQFDREQSAIESEFDAQRSEIKRRHEAEVSRVRKETQQETERVNREHDDSHWVATSVLDETSEESPKRKYERVRATLEKTFDQQQAQLGALDDAIHEIAERRGWALDPLPPPESDARDLDSVAAEFNLANERARELLTSFRRLRLPVLFTGTRTLWVLIVTIVASGVPIFLFVPPSLLGVTGGRSGLAWISVAAVSASVIGILLLTTLYTASSARQSELFSRLRESVSEARFFHDRWSQLAEQEKRRQQREFEALHERHERQLAAQLERYEAAHQQSLAEIEHRRSSAVNALTAEYTTSVKALDLECDRLVAEIQSRRRHELEELQRGFEQARSNCQLELDRYVADRQRQKEESWDRLAGTWKEQLARFASFVADSQRQSRIHHPDWSQLADPNWDPPREIPQSIRIGEFEVDLAKIPNGVPANSALTPQETTFRIPVSLPFPDAPSLLLETKGQDGRQEAVQAMQVALLRLLTRIPPAKLRLTVIDPVGLGESFSGLMHLADFDELLITNRIWTETGHIESRLAELTEHMENVLQKYLRNEFQTIEEYNHFAGEVAEPYRVLVVADFPNKFSEQAARRLMSIAASGPRCGVYLLMSADQTAQMPNAFDLSAVGSTSNTFVWRSTSASRVHPAFDMMSEEVLGVPDGHLTSTVDETPETSPSFYSREPSLERWPLVVDSPPDPGAFTQIVKNVGEASKDIRRVEVAFSRIAPGPDDVWTRDSRAGIDIPLGRAGATKLQHLRLGKGTNQHMLVAGKTGSGKSTFFHTLITNVGMHYSPREVELYLIDFKKGVEFKAYAPEDSRHESSADPAGMDAGASDNSTGEMRNTGMPHARVIAIESDREFGVSVLQRLDAILNERGELFRRVGVQDVASYRDRIDGQGAGEFPDSLPRILLIIDEFQEFFVEDDRYAQQAALLLDRLVRQGRAFGVHVILGSQTLGGAYSLARSTLGQVAVRVALQCSESDAHLILSEENTAARLLTRPGEAIYNDANGLVEGNHPFQIAWLPDEERAGYLTVMRHFAREQGVESEPPIVFEGNIPSDPSRNTELMTLVTAPHESSGKEKPQHQLSAGPIIWLGESVDIGPPASIVFQRHAGANLLIVGADPGAATGILSTGLIALAAQDHSNRQNRGGSTVPFFVFDGSQPGSPESDLWQKVTGLLPQKIELVTPQLTAQALADLTAERIRRDAAIDEYNAPLFVFIIGVSKFRDLRKSDDDFSLGGFGTSSDDAAPDPSRQFADLLSGGPAVGIHTLLWSDSYGNVDRWLSRQSLREFELRIAFSMNATDSANLIDSPAASRLGVHRALLYREETGMASKFRPYGPPGEEWLGKVQTALFAEREFGIPADLDGFRVS